MSECQRIWEVVCMPQKKKRKEKPAEPIIDMAHS